MGETEILAGGTDLLSLMKDYLSTPKRVVNIKEIKELQGIRYTSATGCAWERWLPGRATRQSTEERVRCPG